MALVFQYGSNTSSQRLNCTNRLCGDANPLTIVYTKEPFELDFTVLSKTNNCAAADISPGYGRIIWGVLYEIPDYLICRNTSGNRKSLDEIEGEGQNYRKIAIPLRYRNGRLINTKVITYVAINRKQRIQTSLSYVSHIIAGLRAHNAPRGYINYVKKRIIKNNSTLKQGIENM